MSAILDQVYQRIKEIESMFPIPTSAATVDVGTFDAAADRFTFSRAVKRVTGTEDVPPDGKPIRTTEYFLAADAVDVTLRFRVTNAQGDVSVEVNGVPWPSPPGQSVVTAFIGVASEVRFTIRSGPKTFIQTDILNIVRPPIIGAGVFRVPTWPVLIIYDPPADRNRLNNATYSAARSRGISTSVSFSGEQTVTADFLTPSQLADRWTSSLSLVASVYDSYVGAGGAASGLESYTNPISQLIQALPSGSFQSSDATTFTSDQGLDTEITSMTTIDTQGGLGPGLGDLIVYLSNVRLIWTVINGEVSLSLLGWDRLVSASAESIKREIQRLEQLPIGGGGDTNGGGGGRNLATLIASLRALLALDPLTRSDSLGGNPRFAGLNDDPNLLTIELHGPQRFAYEISHSVTQRDKTEDVETQEQTEDQSSGLLSILLPFLGDPTKNTSTTTRSSRSSSREITVGETLSTRVDLHADVDKSYAVAIYFDRVFGTFVFKQVPLSSFVLVSGQVRGPNGAALAEEVVTLFNAEGQQFLTVSDEKGQFSFSAETIRPKPAKLTLVARTVTQEVDWSSGKPVSGVILDQSAVRRVSFGD